ncbi:class I SAM-dependent methyltransferase [Desulfobacula sp.]|uniref:Class I SAM-dependent methyltransferase n=1 Tax=Candidatus Desulfatibia vada TaxID=2841696 RepID=A0A8J6P1Z5_9BACT|nr:class I SAM-dependent methyltransferase [Candidatus Desulfatibia vada]MBL6996621.1 class I SAM-dependent methyltransferase [Desulfobacula sp.]MBL7217720.1 class I SAM-dependent methyltransferase [Desulfobacteraceae bacterium]
MKPQVAPDHYINPSYDSKERFISYWHQINEVISLNPKEVLEIGIGNGFVHNYFKKKGVKIKTLDIDKGLNPDVVGSVLGVPFFDETFDVVACYELLEHLPYSNFRESLKEIHRVSRKHVILSLPDVTTIYRINIELPRIRPIKKLIPHPFHRPAQHAFNGEHYWEIGKTSYPLERIELDIRQRGLNIIKTYRVFEFYYHRFFVLEKA